MQSYQNPPNTGLTTDYDRELDELYAALSGRGSFRYDAAGDPLYGAYAANVRQNGLMAMRDTMGQAAALTGGYGSSYGQAVGQQQYGEYLRSLSEAMPQFYELAYKSWQDEGARLGEQYDRLYRRRDDAAQQAQWAEEQARQAEQLAYDRGRDALADQQRAQEQAAAAEKTAYARQQDSYAALVKLISGAGYRPTDAELQAAGLSREAAEALLQQYLRDNKLLPTGGAGYGSAGASPAAAALPKKKKLASGPAQTGVKEKHSTTWRLREVRMKK